MKKLYLSFATFLIVALSSQAQKILPTDFEYSIPSFFTYDKTPYLWYEMSYEGNGSGNGSTYTIYDKTLTQVASFTGNLVRFECKRNFDKNGLVVDGRNRFPATQTLFNDDEEWEYVEPITKEETTEWGYTLKTTISYNVKKIDGTIIGNISADEWSPSSFMIIDDIVYTYKYIRDENGNSNYYFYNIPEFRKLIGTSNDDDGVKAVPSMVMPASNEMFDLSGRKVLESQKGIVIKDNKKILVK